MMVSPPSLGIARGTCARSPEPKRGCWMMSSKGLNGDNAASLISCSKHDLRKPILSDDVLEKSSSLGSGGWVRRRKICARHGVLGSYKRSLSYIQGILLTYPSLLSKDCRHIPNYQPMIEAQAGRQPGISLSHAHNTANVYRAAVISHKTYYGQLLWTERFSDQICHTASDRAVYQMERAEVKSVRMPGRPTSQPCYGQ